MFWIVTMYCMFAFVWIWIRDASSHHTTPHHTTPPHRKFGSLHHSVCGTLKPHFSSFSFPSFLLFITRTIEQTPHSNGSHDWENWPHSCNRSHWRRWIKAGTTQKKGYRKNSVDPQETKVICILDYIYFTCRSPYKPNHVDCWSQGRRWKVGIGKYFAQQQWPFLFTKWYHFRRNVRLKVMRTKRRMYTEKFMSKVI